MIKKYNFLLCCNFLQLRYCNSTSQFLNSTFLYSELCRIAEENIAIVSKTELMAFMGYSKREVEKALDILERTGMVDRYIKKFDGKNKLNISLLHEVKHPSIYNVKKLNTIAKYTGCRESALVLSFLAYTLHSSKTVKIGDADYAYLDINYLTNLLCICERTIRTIFKTLCDKNIIVSEKITIKRDKYSYHTKNKYTYYSINTEFYEKICVQHGVKNKAESPFCSQSHEGGNCQESPFCSQSHEGGNCQESPFCSQSHEGGDCAESLFCSQSNRCGDYTESPFCTQSKDVSNCTKSPFCSQSQEGRDCAESLFCSQSNSELLTEPVHNAVDKSFDNPLFAFNHVQKGDSPPYIYNKKIYKTITKDPIKIIDPTLNEETKNNNIKQKIENKKTGNTALDKIIKSTTDNMRLKTAERRLEHDFI